MSEEPRFQPGDKVLRMAPGLGPLKQFATYEVESFNPHAADGLKLKGVPDRWNSENFEKLPT